MQILFKFMHDFLFYEIKNQSFIYREFSPVPLVPLFAAWT